VRAHHYPKRTLGTSDAHGSLRDVFDDWPKPQFPPGSKEQDGTRLVRNAA